MLVDYTDEVELLRLWYEKAKEAAIKAESMDSLNKAYIQPLHEFRYCLDHFMRSIDFEQSAESKEIIRKSIFSAVGHLQRSYSDSIEWILVNVKEEYMVTLAKYTNDQIQIAFPEYYTEIRPALEKITQAVNEYKINKSVERATEILSDRELKTLQIVTDQFLTEDVAEKLQNFRNTLHSREESLIEAKRRDRRAAVKDKVILPIITGALGAVIATIITCVLM